MDLPNGTFEHAKIVQTRWGIGLAMIELDDRDDRDDCEKLRLQLWAPVGEDGSEGQVMFRIGLNPEASDEAHDLMSKTNRECLTGMTGDRFEAACKSAGIATMLDQVFAKVSE